MRPQAVIFDVFGTVVDWRTGVAREVAAACRARGAEVGATGFADAWRAEYQPAMAPIRSGERSYTALDDLHRETLDRVLARFGLAEAFDAPARADLARAWEKLPPWPDAVPGLTKLKSDVIVAPCSNGSIALMTRLAKYGGLPWDCILGAEIARDYKPAARVYQASAEALRLPHARVMMAACHNDDLAAAREAGLLTAWFPRPEEWGTGERGAPAQDWDVVARDVEDLAARLGA